MKRYLPIFIVAFLSLLTCQAGAFWGIESADSVSGLNVAGGFDINMLTTLTGTVVRPPVRRGQEQHTVMSVSTPKGAVTVVLGPWWHWKKQTVSFTVNQDLSITGSLAQGKNGAIYLFAQRIENFASGETVTLRSESGVPLWSRAGSGNGIRQRSNGPSSGATGLGAGLRGGRR